MHHVKLPIFVRRPTWALLRGNRDLVEIGYRAARYIALIVVVYRRISRHLLCRHYYVEAESTST